MKTGADLSNSMKQLVGHRILKIDAGENTGSIFTVQIGDKLKKTYKANYEFLDGDYSLMIYCSWRLSNGKSVITTWHEPNDNDGPMVNGLRSIEGKKIKDIQISEYFDLKITLEEDYELSIFSDLSSNQSIDTNWFFKDHQNHYVINKRYQCIES